MILLRLLPLWLAACVPLPQDSDTADDTDQVDPDDKDADGSPAWEDCDDLDADRYPGAEERCDGKDNDCDGALAHGETDSDGDGLLDCLRCDEAGFWDATKHLDDASAIRAAIRAEQEAFSCDYTSSINYLFLRLDNLDGTVECIYTGRTTTVTNQRPDPTNDMNTEHAWPQSEGADTAPARCDLHHLYPSDVDANSARAAYPYGVVTSSTTWSQGGSRLGRDASGQTVFEPRDARKGDIARSMLYFSQRYQMTLPAARLALFKAWHDDDPVDAREWDRTSQIDGQQGSANPFIACPDLVQRAL